MIRQRPELVRVLTNYARMAITFALGIWFVRLLIAMDASVFAVVTLVGTSVGISGMLREMIRGAVVPELGLALHSGDEERFLKTYGTSFWLSFAAAIGAVLILGAIYIALPLLNIPNELRAATGILLLTRALHTFLAILLAPCSNLLPITGRMARMNVWMTVERLLEVLSAFAVLLMLQSAEPAQQLTWFAFASGAVMILTTLCWAFDGIGGDKRFKIRPLNGSKATVRKVSGSVGWNGFVVAAMNLYERFDLFFMNIFFGIAGTVVFGIATQLLAYLRLVTIGIVQGFDATAARMSAAKEGEKTDLSKTFDTMGHLQGMTTLATAAFLFIHTPLIVQLWVGDQLDDSNQISGIVLIFRIMLAGMIARSLTEGWMRYLSGSGNVHRYGPLLFASALLNPFLVFALYILLPKEFSWLCAAIAYTLLLTITHAVLLPRIVSDQTGLSLSELWRPTALPAALTACAFVMIYSLSALIQPSQIMILAGSALIFVAIFIVPFTKALTRL